MKRIFLIVLDSFGVGELPDAVEYGDVGSNTLASISKSVEFKIPNLTTAGLLNIDGVEVGEKVQKPTFAHGRLTEQSKGKDTTIGHWEIAGIISPKPLPVYPNGFPTDLVQEFERRCGHRVVCNKPYSGTDVIRDYGKIAVEEGNLILYTSADSVFQLAAHEEKFGLNELYRCCELAREMLVGEHAVGRVIARPFTGEYPNYVRTSNRHDYAYAPPAITMLDVLAQNDFETIGIGKIYDIFAGKSVSRQIKTKNNTEGMAKTLEVQRETFKGLCFVNLVDFDMMYGHRNDVDGYAKAISEFDQWLPYFLDNMKADDMLIITADHGCDPATESTDHSREYTPLLIYSKDINPVNLGTGETYANIAETILDAFGLSKLGTGKSVLNELNLTTNK